MASVRLTGWPALVVGIGVVAWAGWGFARHLQAVPAAAREAVRAWLAVDYAQPSAHHRLLGFNRGQSGSDGAMAFSLLPASGAAGDTADVTIESLDAHGWKDFLIAHATVAARTADGAPVHAERYLSVTRARAGGWRVMGESSAWNYWYALVPAPRNGSSWP